MKCWAAGTGRNWAVDLLHLHANNELRLLLPPSVLFSAMFLLLVLDFLLLVLWAFFSATERLLVLVLVLAYAVVTLISDSLFLLLRMRRI